MEKNIINIDAHVIDDIRTIITRARNRAYQSINETLIRSNWEIGKRIVEEEQLGKQRADYGIQLIKSISQQLTTEFGSGYGVRNLAYFKQLYQYFPDWEILHTRVQNLSWSHLRCILRVDDAQARLWYIQEAAEQMWSVRTLDRNVASQYYYRLLQTSNEHKDEVENEMKTLTKGYADSPAMFIKSPMVTEFLGLSRDMSFSESELESAIITHLQKFLMEMGKGYAFVERQQHIITDTQDYYIDLVFYNYLMKCFVLIDLKTTKITHQDVGQMDMYVRMYDELKRTEGDTTRPSAYYSVRKPARTSQDFPSCTTVSNYLLQNILHIFLQNSNLRKK